MIWPFLWRWLTGEPPAPPVMVDETEAQRQEIRRQQAETAAVLAALRAQLRVLQEVEPRDR